MTEKTKAGRTIRIITNDENGPREEQPETIGKKVKLYKELSQEEVNKLIKSGQKRR